MQCKIYYIGAAALLAAGRTARRFYGNATTSNPQQATSNKQQATSNKQQQQLALGRIP
jgi:hypothetical protein